MTEQMRHRIATVLTQSGFPNDVQAAFLRHAAKDKFLHEVETSVSGPSFPKGTTFIEHIYAYKQEKDGRLPSVTYHLHVGPRGYHYSPEGLLDEDGMEPGWQSGFTLEIRGGVYVDELLPIIDKWLTVDGPLETLIGEWKKQLS